VRRCERASRHWQQQQQQQKLCQGDVDVVYRAEATGSVADITSSTTTTGRTDNGCCSVVVIVAAVRTLVDTAATDAQQAAEPVERLTLNLHDVQHV